MTVGVVELGVVFLIAAVLGIAAKFLKQPIVLAYLLTGIFLAHLGLFDVINQDTFRLFADLGIMFLLFLVGLEINYASLRLVGAASLILGFGQIIFTSAIGFLIAYFLNFTATQSAYIAIALMFSSTVIVVKLLSEKKDLYSLYGRLSVGLLLVQDFVAILILVFLSGLEAHQGVGWFTLVFSAIKGLVLFFGMLWVGRRLLPSVFDKVARSQELLFLISTAWVFLVAIIVKYFGFSLEIAGFLAGIALANSSEQFEISARIKPLRDFFLAMFFVVLGSTLTLTNLHGLGLPIIVLSLFVLIGNPLIVLILMGLLGYRKRTSFLTGITVAQISEFSFVLATLGAKLGHIPESVVSLITAVGIITILTSTYLIIYADWVFGRFSKFFSFFERKNPKQDGFVETKFAKPVVLIGAHRTGQSIMAHLPKEELLVIEFDPEVIEQLKRWGVEYVFGDIVDPDIYEHVSFKQARLVISTLPDLEDNLMILSQMRFVIPRPKVIVRAEDGRDAKILYDKGADYVLLPNFTAGQYLGKTIAVDPHMRILEQLRKSDLETLERLTAEAKGI